MDGFELQPNGSQTSSQNPLVNAQDNLEGKSKLNRTICIASSVVCAVVAATAVGLIVHFAIPCDDCGCTTPAPPTTAAPTVAPTTTPAPPTPQLDLRLPDDWIPEHYKVDLWPDIYSAEPSDFHFDGSTVMTLTAAKATNKITFHFRKMTINDDAVEVKNEGTDTNLAIKDKSIIAEKELFVIELEDEVAAGTKVDVHVTAFNGSLRMDHVGMYWSDYKEGNVTKYMMATQFEALDARKAFPCLDEPHMRAKFTVSLGHHPGWTALSNMPGGTPDCSGTARPGWCVTHFDKTTVTMPTYLMAFSVNQYKSITTLTAGPNKKRLTHWSRPEYIDNGWVNISLDVGSKQFDYLESVFKFNYSLPKQDEMTIDDYASGAMENWGLITYLEEGLVWDPNHSSLRDYEWMVAVIAHELTHQWLGNVVTCKWWDHLWLQEGMATYYEHPTSEDYHPLWDEDTFFLKATMWGVLIVDSSGTSHPLYNKGLMTEAQIDSTFSSITYSKGGSIIRMVKFLMLGASTYDKAMVNYIDEMQYNSAEYPDLVRNWVKAAEDESMIPHVGFNMTRAIYTWIEQNGYPLITVSKVDDNTVSLRQEIFLRSPNTTANQYPFGHKWYVPVALASPGTPVVEHVEWLEMVNKDAVTIDASSWVIGNHRARGFYRVNYDDGLWDALITQLNADYTVINHASRAQLIEDGSALMKLGLISATRLFKLMEHLETDTDNYIPWLALDRAVSGIDGLLDTDTKFYMLKAYMRKLVKQVSTMALQETRPWFKEDLFGGYLNNTALNLACRYDDADCVKWARDLFALWMLDPTNTAIIPPDVRPTVYCTAIAWDVDGAAWRFLKDQWENMEPHFSWEPTNRRNGLSCSRDYGQLYSMYDYASQPNVRSSSTMNAVIQSPLGRQVAWHYLDANWDDLLTRFTPLGYIAATYKTQDELDRFDAFVQRHPPTVAWQLDDFAAMRATIVGNMHWYELNADDLYAFLETASAP